MCLTEPNVDAENLYHVLGVQSGASSKDICAAYKRLALRYHPDKNLEGRDRAEHAFKRITSAYETLSNPAKRQEYDGAHARRQPHHNKENFHFGSFKENDDLFQMFFGAGKGGYEKSSGINIDVAGIFNFDNKPPVPPKVPKAPARSPPTSQPAHAMQGGTAVVIHGLAKTPEHNGKSAKVREWNAQKGRYEVQLSCRSLLSLRPQNLTQLCNITISNAAARPELQGKDAEVVDFNSETGRYVLLFNEPPSVVEFPAEHCIFPVGTAAVLKGLSDDKLNGQMCQIVAIDHAAARYLVQCEGGRQLKVKFERVSC